MGRKPGCEEQSGQNRGTEDAVTQGPGLPSQEAVAGAWATWTCMPHTGSWAYPALPPNRARFRYSQYITANTAIAMMSSGGRGGIPAAVNRYSVLGSAALIAAQNTASSFAVSRVPY